MQALPAARTNRRQVAPLAIHIMDAVQLAAASVSSTLQFFCPTIHTAIVHHGLGDRQRVLPGLVAAMDVRQVLHTDVVRPLGEVYPLR